MAEERVITIRGDLRQAEDSFKQLTDTILEQKRITIELEEELLRLKRLQAETPKTAIAAQKKINDEINLVTDSLKEQRIALKDLNLQKQESKADISFQKQQSFINKELIQGRKYTGALNSVTGGYFGQLRKGVKLLQLTKLGFASAAKSVSLFSKALIASGIGAIIVAVGLLIANFDKLKNLVNGVSAEQTKLLQKQTDSVAAEEKKLEAIENSENILKQQGKSEKEILQLKAQQTQEVITQLEAQLETQKQIKKSQIEAAERNKSILMGVLQAITFPLATVLATIDEAASYLGLDSNLREGLYGGIAELVFDPEEVAEEGDKTIEETENKLNKLKNRLAGFQNSVTAIEKTEDDKRKKEALKAEDDFQKKLEAIRQGGIATQDQIREEELRKNREYYQQLMNDALAIYGVGSSEYLALVNAFNIKQNEINAKYAKADEVITEETQEAKVSAIGYYADAAQSVSALLGEQTAAGKAFAVASALMNTYSAANKVLTDETIPGTFAKIAAMFTVITTGLANVKNIMKVNVPGRGNGGMKSVASAAPAAPQFNIVGAAPTTQLASAIGEQTQEPVQAYVVSQDVTTAQSLENNIIQGASLGD